MPEQTQAQRDILAVVPERGADLARLRVLASADEAPVVTVVGKYNHGKSRLLNELIGSPAFAVADKRETTALAERLHQDVRWLDAPGLDADVGNEDDRHALRAAWLESDIRLMVHAAKEGELDADELALLHELHADGRRSRRQTLFVLSQVDQLAEEAGLADVLRVIQRQFPEMALHPVSATRHHKGVAEGKRLLLEKSGIPALKAGLEAALQRVPGARAHEAAMLQGEIRTELEQTLASHAARQAALQDRQSAQRRDFEQGLRDVLAKLALDMEAVLDVPGPDHSLVPDAAEDRYRMTAGKQERARLQIAYSRACLHLNAFLTRHGVFELPSAQQTAAQSLNTVVVAVLGVSVKYRDDLRKIFCEPSGHGRLEQQFAHYYELSSDRAELAAQIVGVQADIAAVRRAMAALQALGGVE